MKNTTPFLHSGSIGTYVQISTAPGNSDILSVGSDYYGIALENTGTSTKARIWKNPGKTFPSSASTWNGNSIPNWTLSNSGTYLVEPSGKSHIGIALFQYVVGYPVSLDNFCAGDIGTGVSTTSLLPTTTTTVQPTTSSSTTSLLPATTTAIPTTSTVSVIDSDSDGIPDAQDNCPNKPNGPSLGTCMPGSDNPGLNCQSDADCVIGCSSNGKCSLNQEDSDVDGVG